MPNVKSAEKRVRQNIKSNAANVAVRSEIKTTEKRIISALGRKAVDESKEYLKLYFKRVDKAVGKGLLAKNTAARKKSRLAKKIYGSSETPTV